MLTPKPAPVEKHLTTVRIPVEILRKVDKAGEENNLSRNEVINQILSNYFEDKC